jgi:hypothetical protein
MARRLAPGAALPAIAALALVVAAGVVHGRWSRRWAGSAEADAAVARLRRVPEVVGGWRGRPIELDPRQLAAAGVDGCVARRFEDPKGAAAVTVLLVCGRPGPISVHTPDVCYGGAGYEAVAPPARYRLPGATPGGGAGLNLADFRKANTVTPSYLRVVWAWGSEGRWEAPDNPRLAFASRPALYKLYVVREADAPGGGVDGDPGLAFLRELLPALGEALFGGR